MTAGSSCGRVEPCTRDGPAATRPAPVKMGAENFTVESAGEVEAESGLLDIMACSAIQGRADMNNTNRISGVSALAWSALFLVSFTLLVLLGRALGFDAYDIERGMRVLDQQPVLVIGEHIAFAWSGAAFVLMVLAFYERLPADMRSYPAKAAIAFGLMAGTLFLFFGLVGGFASLDLPYVQSVRSAAYVKDAYLPLTLVTNRTLAAAITVSGLWFALTNWAMLHDHALPRFVCYLGLGVGVIALSGFVQPGADYGLLGLLLGALWAILVGIRLLRT